MGDGSIRLQWHRRGRGFNYTKLSDGHVLIAQRIFGYWRLHYDGGFPSPQKFSRLSEAKNAAPSMLRELLSQWESRQTSEARKVREQRATDAKRIVRECRLKDSRLPPEGISWFDWAEKKIGTTAAEIRDHDRRLRFFDALNEFYYEQMDLDWIRDRFSEWMGDNAA